MAVPDGWPVRADGPNGVLVTGPRGGPTLRVTAGPTPADPVAALIAQERDITLAGYRRVRIERLPDSRDAVWEFGYEDPKQGPVHGRKRVFVNGATSVTLDWRTRRDDWAGHLAELSTVVGSFTPKTAR